MNLIINFFRNLFGIPVPPDSSDDPCNIPVCIDAKKRLATARSHFERNCLVFRVLNNGILPLINQILSTPIWSVVALVAIATIAWFIGGVIGGTVALVLWALIAIYGFCWLLSIVIKRMIYAFLERLELIKEQIINGIREVLSQCPEQCRGDVDISIPECPLD